MSKKVTAIVLALSMLLCFTACGNKADSNETDTSQNGAVGSSEGIQSSESELEPKPETEPDPKTTPEYHFTKAVQERGVLTVGVSGNSKTCYVIPDDPEKYGELVGTRAGNVPEVCRRIAEELGVEVEFVEYATLEAQLQAVTDGDVDLAADNFMITEERLALYEMTDDFNVREIEGDEVFLSTNPQSWLPSEEETEESSSETEDEAPVEPEPREMIQSEEELAHARIAAVKGSVQATNTAEQYPEAELHLLPDNKSILEALIAGEVDAGVFSMIDRAFADEIVEEIVDGNVAQCGYEVVTPDFRGYGLVLMKENEKLCQSINEIIAELKESGWLLECFDTEEAKAVERGIV